MGKAAQAAKKAVRPVAKQAQRALPKKEVNKAVSRFASKGKAAVEDGKKKDVTPLVGAAVAIIAGAFPPLSPHPHHINRKS